MAIQTLNWNDGWNFLLCGDSFARADAPESEWQTLNLPHDWSVEQNFTIDAAGMCRNAWLPQGCGVYRKHFQLTPDFRKYRAVLCFGGCAGVARVVLNGHKIGGEDWAFAEFEAELPTDFLTDGDNLVEVFADQSDAPVCRWYQGAGLYRAVTLEFRSRIAEIPRHGLFFQTESIREGMAVLKEEYHLKNHLHRYVTIRLEKELLDPSGNVIESSDAPHGISSGQEIWMTTGWNVPKPQLWSPENPALYTVRHTLRHDGEIVDRAETRIGIRTLYTDSEKGFFLNGKQRKLNGVCLHNDAGALGSACEKKAIVRQLEILKTMGCCAVRTAHNPFGENFLDACDECGMLVLAEIFDEWREPQHVAPCDNGEGQSQNVRYYAEKFDRRAEQDVTAIVRRDRNHPSIFMWTIGNEVKEMNKFSGLYIAGNLQQTVKNADPSRPVTCALVSWGNNHEAVSVLEIGGYNYPAPEQMDEFHARHPGQPMIVTECYSPQTRRPLGVYSSVETPWRTGDRWSYGQDTVDSFQEMAPGMTALTSARDRTFIMGCFIWTGFDYLGEPTPYGFPSHSSYFGVIDLCGFPKDGYYACKSIWQPELPLVHLADNWTHEPGEHIGVLIVTNCPSGVLKINGRQSGVWNRPGAVAVELPYEAGELSAEGLIDGRTAAFDTVFTAGRPVSIRMTPYFGDTLTADGHDLEFLCCEILDGHGRPVRNAALPITFSVRGAGTLAALDNGLQTSMERFQCVNIRHTCAGRCLAVIRTGTEPGELTVEASTPGLPPAVFSCRTKHQNEPEKP